MILRHSEAHAEYHLLHDPERYITFPRQEKFCTNAGETNASIICCCSIIQINQFKCNNFQIYILYHANIFQEADYLKADCYNGIDRDTSMRLCLACLNAPFLKTAVQICKSKPPTAPTLRHAHPILHPECRRLQRLRNVAATANEVAGIRLKSKD